MTTRAIAALIEIMSDEGISARRRIEACEGLLAYESPSEIVQHARAFLESVFENDEQSVQDRLDAVKLARKFEAPKITPRTVHTRRETDRREAWRRYEILQRKFKLVLATKDHPPKGWDDDLLSPDYLPPPGSEWPPTIPLVMNNRDKERG